MMPLQVSIHAAYLIRLGALAPSEDGDDLYGYRGIIFSRGKIRDYLAYF